MIDRGKLNLLGVGVDAIDYEAAIDRLIESAKGDKRCSTAALAVHGVMTGVLDNTHRHRLNSLDLVVPDGQPVRWALNILHGCGLPDRVYGPTLALKLCEAAAEERLPVYFYGSVRPVVEKLTSNIHKRFPGLVIAGSEPSLFRKLTSNERYELIKRIRSAGTKITFVGLGCPRQEIWAFEFADLLSMPTIAVGAAFDFHAGTLRQAPSWLQNAGLEWAFRLAMEPRRLWRRYLFLNPLFVLLVTLQLTRIHQFRLSGTTAPKGEELFG